MKLSLLTARTTQRSVRVTLLVEALAARIRRVAATVLAQLSLQHDVSHCRDSRSGQTLNLGVGLRANQERCLRGLQVLVLSEPRIQARRLNNSSSVISDTNGIEHELHLQSAAVRKRQGPRIWRWERRISRQIHRVEVQRSFLLRLTTRKELQKRINRSTRNRVRTRNNNQHTYATSTCTR